MSLFLYSHIFVVKLKDQETMIKKRGKFSSAFFIHYCKTVISSCCFVFVLLPSSDFTIRFLIFLLFPFFKFDLNYDFLFSKIGWDRILL